MPSIMKRFKLRKSKKKEKQAETVEQSKAKDSSFVSTDEEMEDEMMGFTLDATSPDNISDIEAPDETVSPQNKKKIAASYPLVSPTSVSKFGNPIITAQDKEGFHPSLMKNARDRKTETVVLKEAPPANKAAFCGPPRYDWIDIETTAAVKIQSIGRMFIVLQMLGDTGKETKRMRNRRRKRQAMRNRKVSDDAPFFMSFCGVGFLFGDSSLESEEMEKQKSRAAYDEKQRQIKEKEENKRRYRWRNKDTEETVEAFEVVDNRC